MNFNEYNISLCAKCRGRGLCGKKCIIYSKIGFQPKTKTHFSGSSPPEIFVGRYNYPDINAGILTPDSSDNSDSSGGGRGWRAGEKLDTSSFSMPEIWHEKNLPIDSILQNRSKLIYGRFKTQIRTKTNKKFLELMQEISMAYKSVSTEFFLKKAPRPIVDINKNSPVIGNPAPLEFARLEENPQIKPKVEYLVSDSDNKAINSIQELYRSNIQITNINKILSAGLLGLKTQRKLVPTRWSITAVDDTISKNLLKNIRFYPEISEILLFNSEYNGNHYEILLLPDKFSFEVLEAEMRGGLWNQTTQVSIMKDYELFRGRKTYADEVTGGYYAVRLGLCEYLEKIKHQATAIFMREVRPEYYAPLGVGILREISREAFKHNPQKFSTINEAIEQAQTRLNLPISTWTQESVLLKEFGKQKKISQWI